MTRRYGLRLQWSLILVLSLWTWGCSSSGPEPAECPQSVGPALQENGTYVLVAHTFDETWRAVSMQKEPIQRISAPGLLPETGLLGRAPNDLDIVGGRMYAVNSLSNSVQELDLTTGETLGCIDLGVDVSPWELLVDPEDPGRGFVTGWLSGELLEVDLESRRVTRRVELKPGVQGLCTVGGDLLVTSIAFKSEGEFGQGEVFVLSKDSLKLTRTLSVPTNPQSFVVDAIGLVHVICTGDYNKTSGSIARLNSKRTAVQDVLPLGGSPNRAVLAPNKTIYVSGFNGIMTYDAQSFTVLRGAENPLLPNPVAEGGYTDIEISGGAVIASHLGSVSTPGFLVWISIAQGTILNEVIVGNGPAALAVWDDAPAAEL